MATIETYDIYVLDMLTKDSVSIITKTMTNMNNTEVQVGNNIRRAFVNSAQDRQAISEYLPEPYLSSVMQVWGDTPTVIIEEPVVGDSQ